MSVISYNRTSDIVAALLVATTESGTPSGSATLNFDSIDINITAETTNNKGGQDLWAVNRVSGLDWSCDVTAKFGSGQPKPTVGGATSLVITGGGAETCLGICTDLKKSYSDNSTYSFTIKAHGTGIS